MFWGGSPALACLAHGRMLSLGGPSDSGPCPDPGPTPVIHKGPFPEMTPPISLAARMHNLHD